MKKIFDMPTVFLEKLLEAINKNFLQIEKHGSIIRDYFTDYFPMYQELLTDFFNEKEQLYGAYQFTINMTWGGAIKYLLQLELNNRALKYAKK